MLVSQHTTFKADNILGLKNQLDILNTLQSVFDISILETTDKYCKWDYEDNAGNHYELKSRRTMKQTYPTTLLPCHKIIVTTQDELEQLIQTSVKKALSEQASEGSKSQNLLFTVDQASEFLNLAKQTLYTFTSKRQIPFIKRGKKLYFKKADLESWLNEGKKATEKEIKAGLK